ncbi:MAG TPA: ABC-F family ATP-binding cassette domain-containing protein [Bacteroidales bacterium]|nr:ABC-F family ATP-binding cassette domain-containing protein [Bacteroidales bacterium]
MLSVNNISVHFTGEYIFDGVSFLINDRDRIGLVGKNGAGKTTLLNIIAGELEPEKGAIASPSGQTLGYLKQEMDTGSQRTVIEEARQAFRETIELDQKIRKITEELSRRTDFHSPTYLGLVSDLNDATDHFNVLGGHKMDENTEKVLLGLGFERKDFSRPLREFSSGWQMRVELAKILLRMPDILLLDEPTNHLDIESIQWLEEFLISYPGAIVLVSHDRAFLDNVTRRTIEITLGKIYDYKASYSEYEQLQAGRREREIAGFNNQQQQIAQIERFIERFRYKNTKARQVQSRLKMLDKMDRIEIEDTDKSAIRFRFPPAPHSGKVVVRAENLTKSYGHHLVLKNLNFSINKGEKIAFVGRNGEGKSTLSKVIIGELPFEGKLELGHLVKIGYYAQNQHEMLDMEKTVFETIDEVATGEMRTKVKGLLGSFLFRGDDLDKKVKVLSGGEKSRLSLARMLLSPVNLLVLDEPTNHLDMSSKDILKNALLHYDGTLVIVSHDRDFLSGLTEKVIEFRNRGIREYLGDVHDFLESRRLEHLNELEKKQTKQQTENNTEAPSQNKLDFERRKQQESKLRRLQNRIEKSEQSIEKIEKEIAVLDNLLANPEPEHPLVISGEIYHQYEKLKADLAGEMNSWEALIAELEEQKNSLS